MQRIQTVFFRFPALALVSLLRRESDNAPLKLFLTAKEGAKDNSQLLYKVIGALEMLDLGYGFDVSLKGDNQIHDDAMEIYSVAKNAAIEQEVEKQARQAEIEEAHGHVTNDDYDPIHTQPEAELEESLLSCLTTLGYERVTICNGDELRANLKRQLEIHNKVKLSDAEFAMVLNFVEHGDPVTDSLPIDWPLPKPDVSSLVEPKGYWSQTQIEDLMIKVAVHEQHFDEAVDRFGNRVGFQIMTAILARSLAIAVPNVYPETSISI